MPTFFIIWLPLVVLGVGALIILRPDRHWTWLVIVSLIIAFSVWVAVPSNPGLYVDTNNDGDPEVDRTIEIVQGLDLAGGVKILLEADIPQSQSIPEGNMDQTRRIIEQRVDALGALEPTIQIQGERRIVVELPGYEDPEAAINLIQETALLEFISIPGNAAPPQGTPVITSLALEQQAAQISEDTGETVTAEDLAAETEEYVYPTVMTGEILQTADPSYDELGNPGVSFVLTSEGSTQFGDYTGDHIGELLGIVLDGQVISAPVINAEIRGQGSITGDFTIEEAQQLATQLRFGALPVPLRVDSTSTIGPTLGQVSVEQSIRAGIIGIAVVLLFMLIYYRLPGASAALALIVFALLNFALFKLIPVTMTLPAITGFLIGVGTAVDGNILIFERLKEELRAGKRVNIAVKAGFDRAWASIRDSNFSTLIIAFILFLFGTSFGAGAVRGFAVTLALGLLINLFTATVVTRTFLHFLLMPFSEEALDKNRWLFGL